MKTKRKPLYLYPIAPKILINSSLKGQPFDALYLQFLAHYSNPITRENARCSINRFFKFCESNSLDHIKDVNSFTVSTFISGFTITNHNGLKVSNHTSANTVLSAVRNLFDFYILHGLLSINYPRQVKAPKAISGKGSTPIIDSHTLNNIIDAIPLNTAVGLRDRALIGVMAYGLLRVSGALRMRVSDYSVTFGRKCLNTVEKGFRSHSIPVHDTLEGFLNDYINTTHLYNTPDAPLFQSTKRKGQALTGKPLSRVGSWMMIRRRAEGIGYYEPIGNHSFRATGITNFIKNGGDIENARKMAGHKSTDTTQLYNRNHDQVDISEVNKIDYFKA